jgi:alkylhydroperoxidase/carboxymuconolactone decarboxylase family protein YurZ
MSEQTLRRLALNDEQWVDSVLTAAPTAPAGYGLGAKSEALIRLGAMLSMGAATASLRWMVEMAKAAGASDDEIVGVLVAIAPAVGVARVVSSAAGLAVALGYELDDDERG